MGVQQLSGDLAVFTVDSNDLLTYWKDATLTIDNQDDDGSPVVRVGGMAQIVKSGFSLSASLMTAGGSAPEKRSNLDITAWSIAGSELKGSLRSGTLTIRHTTDEGSGAGERWKFPLVTKKFIEISGEIQASDTEALAQLLPSKAASATLSDAYVTVTITFAGITVTLPMAVTQLEHKFSDGKIQTFGITLKGRSPDSGTYPTAPTGSSSLLEKAFNAIAAYAFTFTSHTSKGTAYTGNVVLDTLTIQFNDAQLLMANYTWMGQGTLTPTTN